MPVSDQEQAPDFKAGYVTIIGRPNVGKSTLLNQLVEHKVSIVTRKPQTTRWQLRGIKSTPAYQIVFTDTPGYQHTHNSGLNRFMNREVVNALAHIDVVVFVVEALKWEREDSLVAELVQDVAAPLALVINKLDLLKERAALLPYIDSLKEKFAGAEIIPISARRRRDVTRLEQKLACLLPTGEPLFPPDQISDKSARFLAAEYIREQVMTHLGDELPYRTTITIDQFKEEKSLLTLYATIWVERRSQRAILIGANGKMLKSIGYDARVELEKFFAKKVYLQTWVKVKRDWTEDAQAMQTLGYI